MTLRRTAIAVGLLALVVRLAALAATHDLPLTTDPAAYDRHARALVDHGEYPAALVPAGGPTALRAPGFPYFLAGVYRVFGESVTAGRVAQAVVGALIAVLVTLIAFELFGLTVAAVAGVLAAIFPPLVIDGMTLFTEPLFVMFELLAVLAVLLWRRTQRLGWVVAAGVACGLALLTRPNAFVVLIVLVFAAREAGRWRRLRKWRAPALLAACALLVVAPWTIRNAVAFDAFVPISTQDGFTALGTYNPESRAHDALWIVVNSSSQRILREHAGADEAELDGLMRTESRRFATDHPGYVVEVAWRNTLRLFNLGGASLEREIALGQYGLGSGWAKLMTWSLFPILILALAGAFLPATRRAPPWVWLIPVLLLTTVFILAANRHRAGIDPFLLMLAAVALVWGWERLRVARA